MWFIELGLPTYFILKGDRILTTAIFTGSASTVHNSFKIMFQNVTFWCYPGHDKCLSVLFIALICQFSAAALTLFPTAFSAFFNCEGAFWPAPQKTQLG